MSLMIYGLKLIARNVQNVKKILLRLKLVCILHVLNVNINGVGYVKEIGNHMVLQQEGIINVIDLNQN